MLEELLVSSVAGAADSAAPIDAVVAALEAAGALLQERRAFAGQRQMVIAANAELRERELIKLASLASALADALRRRGVSDPATSLTAEAGIAVFKVAFERWLDEGNQKDLFATHPRVTRRVEGGDIGHLIGGGNVDLTVLPNHSQRGLVAERSCFQCEGLDRCLAALGVASPAWTLSATDGGVHLRTPR